MKLQHVESIVTIVKEGSISGAATRLGKTQPALTKVVRQAERDLGLALFRRSARGMIPSKAAKPILERMQAIDTDLKRLKDLVEEMRGAHTGKVTVCMSPLAAVSIIPRALKLFRKTHPGIDVRLSSGLYPGALGPLRNGETDMVVGPTPPEAHQLGFAVEPLMRTEVIVLASIGSPYAKARSLAELSNADWIMIGEPGGPGDVAEDAFRKHGLPPPKIVTNCESYFGTVSLVEKLGAVCGFPQRLLPEVERSWRVARIPIRETIDSREISVVTRAGHPPTPAAEAMTNCIRRVAATIEHRSAASPPH